MNNLAYLPLLEHYISENGASTRFTVPFLKRKNTYNVELQNWKDYQDIRKSIITIRQSGIRVSNIYPCLTHIPNIPIIYDQEKQEYRYLTKEELLSLQSFPLDYRFPENYSLKKIVALLGNSINLTTLQQFLKDKLNFGSSITINLKPKFVELFAGIGSFHLVLKEYCSLAVDINKNCQKTYQLNFPNTPFLLGDINNKEIQQKIIDTDFDLLCAGFPCQPYSRAGKTLGESKELTSLLTIINKKKPSYLLLENVPNFLVSPASNKLFTTLLKNYHLQISVLNPKDLGVNQHRPRLFVWGRTKETKV